MLNSTRENCNCVGLAMLLCTGQSHRTKKISKSSIFQTFGVYIPSAWLLKK